MFSVHTNDAVVHRRSALAHAESASRECMVMSSGSRHDNVFFEQLEESQNSHKSKKGQQNQHAKTCVCVWCVVARYSGWGRTRAGTMGMELTPRGDSRGPNDNTGPGCGTEAGGDM